MRSSCPRFTLLLAVALAAALWPSIFGGKVLLPLDLLSSNPPHTPPELDPGGSERPERGAGRSAAPDSTDAPHPPVHNPLIGDMLYENYMWKVFQRRAIAAGDLPLWNPYSFCGHPLYTTGQASTFYPLNAIFWIMPPARAYVVFIGLHLLLGGVFTYLFLRRVGAGDFGASVGGVVFAMGGFFACRLVFPMLLSSAIWLPLMLLWLHNESQKAKSRKPKDPTGPPVMPQENIPTPDPPSPFRLSAFRLSAFFRPLAWGAPLFALPILGGFFEIAFYAYAACGLFVLVTCVGMAVWHGAIAPAVRFAAASAAVVLLALVIAAPQILPFLEVMKLNVRAGEGSYDTARASALAGRELLLLFMPDALGNPTVHESFNLSTRQSRPIDGGRGARYFGPKNYVEASSYLGILPLAFALMSLRTPAREKLFFWVLLIVALGMALVTPLYRVFFHLVPGSEQVRTPFRWLFLVCFALTCLAAVGAQRWFEGLGRPATPRSRFGAACVVGAALLICGAVAALFFAPAPLQALARCITESSRPMRAMFRDPDELAGLFWLNGLRLAVLLLGAAAFIGLGAWRSWSPRGAAMLSTAAIAFIALDLGQASFPFNTHGDPQVLARTPPVLRRLQADRDLFRIGRFGPQKILYANLPTLYGLQDYGGYDSIILSDYARFLEAIEPQHLMRYNIVMTLERRSSLDSPLWPLLNIRYLLTRTKIPHSDWELVPVEGNVRLYRIRAEKELPRAFLVGRVRAAGSPAEAIEVIRGGSVNLREEAVVQATAETAGSLAEPGAAGPTARIIDYRPSSVTLATRSDRRSLLVLTDVHYPGWKAYVDGTETGIFVANGIFRGVSVPGGEHTVVFRFEPLRLRVGTALSLSCLTALAALSVCGRRRSRPTAR